MENPKKKKKMDVAHPIKLFRSLLPCFTYDCMINRGDKMSVGVGKSVANLELKFCVVGVIAEICMDAIVWITRLNFQHEHPMN